MTPPIGASGRSLARTYNVPACCSPARAGAVDDRRGDGRRWCETVTRRRGPAVLRVPAPLLDRCRDRVRLASPRSAVGQHILAGERDPCPARHRDLVQLDCRSFVSPFPEAHTTIYREKLSSEGSRVRGSLG